MSENNKQKLELTWIGKNDSVKPEPRVLLYDKEKSYGDPDTENMLIHGDNLLALKALEQDYAGQVKCVYIDPPYNTGSAFEHYDDNLEHSTWLNLIHLRLVILKNLLSADGVIFVQIDDKEQGYLRVIMDEIFGRSNFLNTITVKTKVGGVSGSSVGKSLKDSTEFIHVFAKNKADVQLTPVYIKTNLTTRIKSYEAEGKSWKYTSVLTKLGDREFLFTDELKGIKYYGYRTIETMSVKAFAKLEKISEEAVYRKFADKIFQTTNAQSSVRQTVINETSTYDFPMYSIEYTPTKGKNAHCEIEILYKGEQRRMMMFLSDSVELEDNEYVYLDKITTLWDDLQYNNLTKEGNVQFPNGKKPESLLERVLTLATQEEDLVLDSFLGSGTTAAVATKMNRRYIGIELRNHCYTHCQKRLISVIDGEDSGISKSQKWKGGGGFKFYELAPSLIKIDERGNKVIDDEIYNLDLLAAAVSKINGYKYKPDEKVFWKQGSCSENSYIFTTIEFITPEYLDKLSDDLGFSDIVLVCCPAFESGLDGKYENIDLKKIPQSILDRCEFGKDNYNLNIIDTSDIEDIWEDEVEEDE